MSNSVTNLINRLAAGDADQLDQLLPLIYQELRVVARSRLAQVGGRGALDTTGLVHEAYVKLVGAGSSGAWENRRHFYATAALAMRQLLVDQARRHGAEKRGGDLLAVTLDEQIQGSDPEVADVLALNDALEQLAVLDEGLARLVEMRFFLGLTVDEVAEITGSSKRSLARDWQRARAFLQTRLS